MSRPDSVPVDADMLDAVPYLRRREEPSAYVPGVNRVVPELSCPGCDTRHPATFGRTIICTSCGLSLHLDFNLYAWRSPIIGAHEVKETTHVRG